MRPVRILVFVQTALALVFTYSDSSRGPAPARLPLPSSRRRPGSIAPQVYSLCHPATRVFLFCHPGAQPPCSLFVIPCGPGPAKTSVFVGGCRPRDPDNMYYILFVIVSIAKQSSHLCRRECDTTFTTNHFNT